ncbi:hypothetical protein FACS189444_0460 [Spirochaetia bacterium]|nr:hypothetical protein FACS189444_0460 [Spirochaetia bacterium]
MATQIKRIEKEFLLKFLFDERIPIMYLHNRTEYILTVEKPPKGELYLKPDRPITGLSAGQSMELMFDYHGQVISFSAAIKSVGDKHFVLDAPDLLYKNLDRSYKRVNLPVDLSVQFSFLGDRYSLAFPKIVDEPEAELGEMMDKLNPKDVSLLIGQLGEWVKGRASGHKLVLFKDVKPVSIEECLVAETGKALYLPSTAEALPKEDPYPRKRLITEERFRRYLERTGVTQASMDDAVSRFVRSKVANGFFSDAWVPILFERYVIGYIHIWINQAGIPPFDYGVIETLYQFAKILAFSLKTNGYFKSSMQRDAPFEGAVLDISASGLLFAYLHSPLAASLLPEGELLARIVAPKRTINATVKIVRCYKDHLRCYFGCRFLNIVPEDMRFLFEHIYGKPMTADPAFLSGQV